MELLEHHGCALTTILGLDISSTQLNGALLIPGQAPILRAEKLGKASDPLIERLRNVPTALWDMSVWAFSWTYDKHPDWVVIEEPAGKYGTNALRAVLGAITASVPRESQIAWRKASEWRSDLGAKNTKESGHSSVECCVNVDLGIHFEAKDYDEHELDAIGIALAWSKLLAGQEAA